MADSDFCTVIVRLSPFRDVVKSLTHQFLYGECAKATGPDSVDFAFFPSENERKRKADICGIRTHKKLSEFDLIFISNSFTCELVNLPWLLRHAGLAYSSKERSQNGTKPIIIMGGSNAMASQSVLFSDDEALVDGIFFGEGEHQNQRIVEELAAVPQEQRRAKLIELQGKIPGLKVFGAPNVKIDKAIYHNPKEEVLANAPQYLFDSNEATSARLFIAYDCPAFCTFCFEGWERKPYRELDADTLLQAAKNLRLKTGADTLEITAFNFNTHTDVTKLMTSLTKMYFNVNFMSQRADILAENPALVHYEVAAGKRQHTIGVEGISERMRTYFNKNLSEETALKSIELLLKESVREIKLFYIISGLETQEDCDDYSAFLKKINQMKAASNSNARILCSFGLLVRMPFTPLRYEKLMLTVEEWKPVVENVQHATEAAGYEFRLTYDYDEFFLSQALCMTSAKCAKTLIDIAEHDFIYDQGINKGAWALFKEQVPLTPEFLGEKPADYPFAFDFIDSHIPSAFLYSRYQNAKNGIETPMCLAKSCSGCASCKNEERTALTGHKINIPTSRDTEEIAKIVKAKAQARPVYIEFEILEEWAFFYPETIRSRVMMTILNRVNGLSGNGFTANGSASKIPSAKASAALNDATSLIMTCRDRLFGSKSFEDKISRWCGKTIYEVYPFDNAQRPALAKVLADCGYKVSLEEFEPKELSVVLTKKDSASSQELSKITAKILNANHLPFTMSHKDEYYNFAIAPKFLKKKIITSCFNNQTQIKLCGSTKMDLSDVRKERMLAKFSW